MSFVLCRLTLRSHLCQLRVTNNTCFRAKSLFGCFLLPKSCNRLSIEDVETGVDARGQGDFRAGVAGLR